MLIQTGGDSGVVVTTYGACDLLSPDDEPVDDDDDIRLDGGRSVFAMSDDASQSGILG